jgi:hypothetical protein
VPAMGIRVASNLASFSGIGAEAPGRPRSSLFQCRLPMRPRVAPNPASSGLAGGGVSSCLLTRILQRHRRQISRLPRIHAPPVPPSDEAPGCPEPCIFRLCRWGISGLPRSFAPSAPTNGSPGFPESRTLRLCRSCVFGSPRILHLRLGR